MFDIDKIFLSMKSYTKKDGKLTDKHEEGSMEFHQNRLLDDYIALLCDFIEDKDGNKTTRSMHMLHASIDNDTSLIEDVIEDLQESVKKTPLQSYDAYTLRHMCRAKDDFITGKEGIGPYALNNNSLVLTTLYEVEFAPTEGSIMTRLGLNSLHRQTDNDGESIMSWLSALINIHVDVAKDPKHNKLNINGYTHNLVNLLIRTGFGKNTFYFTTQPVMKELANVINNASGKYMLEKGVSLSKLKKNAEQAFIMNIARANGIKGKTFGTVMHNWEDNMHKRLVGVNATIDWLLQEGSYILRDIAKSGEGINSKKTYEVQTLWDGKPHTEVMSTFDIQMLIYRAFKQFTPYAEALSNLVKYSKIDTKKQGKNLIEQKRYMQGYKAMFGQNSQDKSRLLFKTDGLDRLRDKTYIGRMTENAIGAFTDIMGSQIIQGTDRFIGDAGCMDAVLNTIDRFGSTDEQLLRSVSGSILAKLKSNFFNDYAQKNGIDIKKLVDGNETIFNRLCKIKSEIICVDKYRGLLDANGNIKNYMLRTLVAGYTHDFDVPGSAPYGTMLDDYKSVKFINTLNFIDDESVDQDEFTQAWDDLLNDTRYPELQKFARDLIVYAFITAGDNGGRHDIMKFVPNAWKIQSGYVDEMVKLLNKFNSKTPSTDVLLSRDDIEDIVLNNWYDDNFVHTIKHEDIREFFSKIKLPNGSIKSTEYPTIIGLSSGTNVESEYIKIPRENIGDPESQRKYVLYKHMGYGKHTEVKEREVDGKITTVTEVSTYPIYVAVEPRGNRFTDRHLILSYGRQETARESLTNMCLDALAFKLLIDRGVKPENTEHAFSLLSKIFHETDPVVADYMRQLYNSSIQDVIEEYNKHRFAVEDAINNMPQQPEPPGPVPFAPTLVTKIISGAQTGVDTIGLEVGRKLGLQTGGTITPGFVREKDVDSYTREQLEEFGVQEISPELQSGKSGREFYLPRTEQNVINSDGTVYFASDEDSAGKIATERFAKQHNKPFLLNPTAEELRKWCNDNGIRTLNVAGNRGSKIGNMRQHVIDVLTQALSYEAPTTPIAPTAEEAERRGENVFLAPDEILSKKPYIKPTATTKNISTNEEMLSGLSDKLIRLGLDENNNQNPNAVINARPYDTSSVYSEFRYLMSTVKEYIKKWFGIKDGSVSEYKYSMTVKGINSRSAKLSIADTGGYVNDFSIKENKNGVVITPKHTDMLSIDKMSAVGKELMDKCGW